MSTGRCWNLILLVVAIGTFSAIPSQVSAAKPSSSQTARQVDRLLAEEVFSPGAKSSEGETKTTVALAPRVSDAIFLRRAWLDIVGDIPPPEEVAIFMLDPSPTKRDRIVRELLDNPKYGQNWARYWRDVILSRRLENRAQLVANPLVAELTDRFNRNQPWNEIASSFITAEGDVRENGETAIYMAQESRTEETTAEISRIFLGIQIQCCQCHDHPYDSWKREQFHELAAFFPRTALRPVRTPTTRSFEVIAVDRRDRPLRPDAPNADRRPTAEHYMSDLDHPSDPGTRMQPKFFLTGDKLPFGTPDEERRAAVAEWITESPWFATALVNRLWSELVGEGFYEPIDDIGPERTATAPKAVRLLSLRFADSGYDLKWLFRTIMATEAYQRESRPRRDADELPFTANVAQPLRSDQLFNALLTSLDLDESRNMLGPPGRRRRMRAQAVGQYGRNRTARNMFEAAFGYDPSDPRETVTGSIPQALVMMNGAGLNLAARGQSELTVLGRLLTNIDDDQALVEQLYLRTLSREPTDGERKMALAYCDATGNRATAFEDLFWALLNSAEFSHRR